MEKIVAIYRGWTGPKNFVEIGVQTPKKEYTTGLHYIYINFALYSVLFSNLERLDFFFIFKHIWQIHHNIYGKKYLHCKLQFLKNLRTLWMEQPMDHAT